MEYRASTSCLKGRLVVRDPLYNQSKCTDLTQGESLGLLILLAGLLACDTTDPS